MATAWALSLAHDNGDITLTDYKISPARLVRRAARFIRFARRETLNARPALIRLLEEHSESLRPGIYLQNGRSLRHWRASFPSHFVTSEFRTDLSRLLRFLVAMPHHLIPVLNRNGSSRGASFIFLSEGHKGADNTILLAPDFGWVKRIASEPIFSDEYRDIRQRLSRYIRAPSFHASSDRTAIIEDFIEGEALESLQDCRHGSAMDELFSKFVEVVESEMVDETSTYFSWIQDGIENAQLPDSLRTRLNWDALRPLACARFVPSRPIMPNDVIATAEGLTVIDWSARSVGWRPFWWSSLTFVYWTSPRALIGGELDWHLRALWEAAKEVEIDPIQHRVELAVAHTLWGDPQFDWREPPAVLSASTARRISKRWQAWGSAIPGLSTP